VVKFHNNGNRKKSRERWAGGLFLPLAGYIAGLNTQMKKIYRRNAAGEIVTYLSAQSMLTQSASSNDSEQTSQLLCSQAIAASQFFYGQRKFGPSLLV
jgi:hypothetical protein